MDEWNNNIVQPSQLPIRNMNDIMNERADPGAPVHPFRAVHFMEENRDDKDRNYNSTVMGRYRTKISDKFLDHNNIDRIQLTIRDIIWQDTGVPIERQPDTELVQVMTYIYDTHMPTIPKCKEKDSITILNHKVYELLVPIMKDNLRGHLDYLKQLKSQPSNSIAYDRPQSTRKFASDKQ